MEISQVNFIHNIQLSYSLWESYRVVRDRDDNQALAYYLTLPITILYYLRIKI